MAQSAGARSRQGLFKSLTVADEALDLLSEKGYSEQMGVRNLKRTIQELVEFPLSRLLLEGVLGQSSGVACLAEHGQIVLKPQ